MTTTQRRALALIAVAGLTVGATPIASTEAAEDPVKARHDTMEGVKDAMMGIAAMAKKEKPFDAAVVAKNAGAMADGLAAAAKLFPEGSEKGEIPSRAKPEVWSQRAGFDEAMKNAHAAALALAAVKDEAALMPALGAVGGTCKACHETYRTPE